MSEEEINKLWIESARKIHEARQDPKNTIDSYLALVPLGNTGMTPPIMNLDQWEELGQEVAEIKKDPDFETLQELHERKFRTWGEAQEISASMSRIIQFIQDEQYCKSYPDEQYCKSYPFDIRDILSEFSYKLDQKRQDFESNHKVNFQLKTQQVGIKESRNTQIKRFQEEKDKYWSKKEIIPCECVIFKTHSKCLCPEKFNRCKCDINKTAGFCYCEEIFGEILVK